MFQPAATMCDQSELIELHLPVRLSRAELKLLASDFFDRSALKDDADVTVASNANAVAGAKAVAVVTARSQLQIYRKRDALIPNGTFGDPGWLLLLDIFVLQAEGERVSVSSACLGSGSPATTALRYIAAYVEQGLLRRAHDQNDGRVVWLTLTAETELALVELLNAVK